MVLLDKKDSMNKIFAVPLVACGLLAAMEQKPLLSISSIEHQVLGYASKTGKIITTKECPNASLGDVAVSPSGEFLAIMNGEWLSVARFGEKGTVAIGEPVRIQKFAGSVLFLDDMRFLIFREKSFREYEIAQNEYGSYSFNRVTKTAYGENGELFFAMPWYEPGALLSSACIVPLRQNSSQKGFLQAFEKLSSSWSSAALSASDIDVHFIASVSNRSCAVGNPQTGVLDWLLYFNEKNPHDMSKGYSFLLEKMCFISVCSKFLFVGYDGSRPSELYTMITKEPSAELSVTAKIPLVGTSIRKIFWKDDGSEGVVVMREGKIPAYLISDIPVASDTPDND